MHLGSSAKQMNQELKGVGVVCNGVELHRPRYWLLREGCTLEAKERSGVQLPRNT